MEGQVVKTDLEGSGHALSLNFLETEENHETLRDYFSSRTILDGDRVKYSKSSWKNY
jgi:hypothetical protein